MKDEGKKPRSYQFVVSVEDGTCTSEILILKVMLGEKKGERRGGEEYYEWLCSAPVVLGIIVVDGKEDDSAK